MTRSHDPDAYGSDPYGRGAAAPEPGSTGAWRRESAGPYGDEPQYGWQPQYEPSLSPGYPARPHRKTAQQRGRQRLLVAVVTALVVVIVLVLGFFTPGWFVTRVFDSAAVQTGVAKILANDYATDGVADVRCPQDVQVTSGATFICDATIDGDPVTIPVTVTDDRGGYQVGRPA